MGGSGKNFNRANWDPAQASPDNPQNPAPYVPTTTYQPFGSGTLSGTGGTNVYHSDPYSGQGDIAASNPADVERDRQRQIGDDMARRQAVQLNFGAASADRSNNLNTRETQIQANDMLRNAAGGGAPSAAAINAKQGVSNTLEAQLGASAGQRGPALAQQNAAAQGAVGLGLQNANAAGYGRSAEANRALLAYGASSGQLRKGDQTMQQVDAREAEAQAQQQLDQNRRNQQGQQQMERLGLGTEQAAMALSNQEANLNNAVSNDAQTNQLKNTERARKTAKDVEDMLPPSDARMKNKASLTSLSARGRELLAQTNANRDSLRYGSSVEGAKRRADSTGYEYPEDELARLQKDGAHEVRYGGGKAAHDDINPSDVDEIRYGRAKDVDPEDVDRITAGPINRGDVNRIKHGDAIDEVEPRNEYNQRVHESQGERLHGYSAGPQHAPEGYAKMRESQIGGNIGENGATYDLGSGYSDDPEKHYGAHGNTYAPGTEDYLRYGKPRMVSVPKEGTNPNDYVEGQAPMVKQEAPMDPYSESVSMSDTGAKRAAFLDGVRVTQQMHDTGVVPPHPEYMREAKPSPRSMTRSEAHTDPEYMREHAQEVEELRRTEREAGRPAPTVNTLLPSERHGVSDEIYNAAERLTRPGEAPRRVQQPGPITARPVPAPVSETNDFNRGVERQFGGAPRAEVPDARARQHLERAKVQSMLDTAPDRMSDQDTKVTSHGEEHAMQQDANRKLQGSTYTYKEGVGEDPSRIHHGQMAQTMERNPITATAVREGPDGFKRVSEFDKLNVTAAGVAELQHQQDEMRAELAKMRERRRRTA